MPADFEKKFKTGRNGEVMLEKPGGGFEKVATVPDGSVVLSATLSDQGNVNGVVPPSLMTYLATELGNSGPGASYSLKSAHIEEFGAAVGGFWDAALAAAMVAAGLRGGIELLFVNQSIYKFASGFPTVPNDGGTAPQAVPISLKGAGSHWSGRGRPMNGSTVLDFQGAATYGKITLTGLGLFKARDITFTDSVATGGALIYTTNTTLDIQSCSFVGKTAGLSATQDAIILGGPNQIEGGSGVTDGFQGYGTVITGNYFHNIRRVIYGRAFCNAVSITHNTIWSTCGAGDDTPCMEIDGAPAGGGQVAAGNMIVGNLFELTNYKYGIKLANAQRNYLHNRFYDSTAKTTAAIRLEATAQYNRIDENFTPGAIPLLDDASGKKNPTNSVTQGVYGIGAAIDYSDTSYPMRVAKSRFYGGVDSFWLKPDAAMTNGAIVFRLTRSDLDATDPGLDMFKVAADGTTYWKVGSMQVNGTRWIAVGAGSNMVWDSGTGGNYTDIKSYALRHYDHTGALIATMSSAATGWNIARPLTWKPAASQTPANNGELTFEATSNTTVTVKLKGSDGVVRSAALTLA